jgi:hypothetical protein
MTVDSGVQIARHPKFFFDGFLLNLSWRAFVTRARSLRVFDALTLRIQIN